MNVESVIRGKSMRRATQGFSLVELLVAMCILAVLAAIVIPIITKARETAKTSKCLSNMRQIGLGMHTYIEEYNGRFPAAVPYGSPNYWGIRGRKTVQELLDNYVSRAVNIQQRQSRFTSVGVFQCPSDSGPPPEYAGTYGIAKTGPVWRSTGSSYQYYASNQQDWDHCSVTIPWTSLSPLIATNTGAQRVGAALSDIPYPSRKAVIGDFSYWHSGDRTTDNHLAFTNTLFADGHAARERGAVHLEARLERLRPWHNATEVSFEP